MTDNQDEYLFLAALLNNWSMNQSDFIELVNCDHFQDERYRALIWEMKRSKSRDVSTLLRLDVSLITNLMGESAYDEVNLYRVVKQNFLRREIKRVYQDSIHEKNGLDQLFMIMEELGKLEAEVSESGKDNSHEAFVKQLDDSQPLIYTGLRPLDDALGGIELTSKIVIGARPSGGKTSLARTLALSFAREAGLRVGYWTLESSEASIRRGILACMTGYSIKDIQRRKFSEQTKQNLVDESFKLRDHYGLNIYDVSGYNAETVAMQMLTSPHTVCIVDHLQKFRSSNGKDLREVIGDASNLFAGVANRKKKIVIMCSQLNRGAEGKEPTFADLKESGDIEQDADIIIFPHQPEGDKETAKVSMDLIIAKNREGEVGRARVKWDKTISRFYAESYMEEPTNF